MGISLFDKFKYLIASYKIAFVGGKAITNQKISKQESEEFIKSCSDYTEITTKANNEGGHNAD